MAGLPKLARLGKISKDASQEEKLLAKKEKYISKNPLLINSSNRQRSVISGSTGTTGSAGSFRKVLE